MRSLRLNRSSRWVVSALLALVTSALLLAPTQVLAVDGILEINATRALAGGVTPGDTPGFPVTLSQRGSYRLTSNLVLSVAGTAIEVTSDEVSIDLNGFSIVCDVSGASCPTNVGYGIEAINQKGLRVTNGFIRGFGVAGIQTNARAQLEDLDLSNNIGSGALLLGDGCVVSRVMAWGNGGAGILTLDCTITDTVALANGATGIATGVSTVTTSVSSNNGTWGFVLVGGTLRESVAHQNANDGIAFANRGTVIGCVSGNNSGVGLRGPAPGLTGGCSVFVAYGHNVFDINIAGQVADCLTPIELNLCDGNTTCP